MVAFGTMQKIFICTLLTAVAYGKSFTTPESKAILKNNATGSADIKDSKIGPTIENNDQDFVLIDDVIKTEGERISSEQSASMRSKLPVPVIRKVPQNVPILRRNIQTAPVRAGRPPIRPSSRRRTPFSRRDGRVNNPSIPMENLTNTTETTSTSPTASKSPEITPKSINSSEKLGSNEKANIDSMVNVINLNNSARAMNAPAMAPAHPDLNKKNKKNKNSTKSSLILGGAISGSALCFFLILMIVVMWMQRSTQSRSQGSIKQIKAKEQAKIKRRVPRMKSMREMKETIFTSFRKVRRPRPQPR